MRTHPPVQRDRPLRLFSREPVLVVIAAVAAIVLVVGLTAPPSRVDRLSVRNPTPYHLVLDVGDGSGAWSPLPIALAGTTTQVDDVLDQGDRWVVRVRAGGIEAGTIAVTRAQLRDAGWTVTVPDGVTERLREAGVDVPAS